MRILVILLVLVSFSSVGLANQEINTETPTPTDCITITKVNNSYLIEDTGNTTAECEKERRLMVRAMVNATVVGNSYPITSTFGPYFHKGH